MATWSVVTTLKEPLDVVLRFVSYYLDNGAAHIYVYFDDADDPAYDVIKHYPQVSAVRREHGFWADKISGSARYRHLNVQNYNTLEAYDLMKTDFMLFVDGDEYLYSPENIGELLDESDADIMIARTSEPAFINAESFGVPMIVHSRTRGDQGKVFAADFDFAGLVGHGVGKSFYRRGQKIDRMRVHRADIADAKIHVFAENEMTLIHYLNFGARHWAQKLGRRIEMGRYTVKDEMLKKDVKTREQMWQETYARGGVDGLYEFFVTYKSFSDEVVNQLALYAHLSDFSFDFSEAISRHFGIDDFEGQNETSIFLLE